MKRVICLLSLMLLSACIPQPDRCTSDPNLPDCRANQAVANATIVAANAAADERARHAQMQATRDAVALFAQATQGAVNSRATDAVVSADATRSHLELDAARQSVVFTATLQAAQFTIITTRTALEGDAKINAALVQRDTAQAGQWLTFGIPSALLVGFTGYVLIYSRRIGASLAAAVDVRANAIHYGYRNERVAYRVKRADGALEFIPLDQILGHSDRYLEQLNVPDLAKLAALVEADKRTKGVLISQHVGAFPVLNDAPPEPVAALPANRPAELTGAVAVPTFAEVLRTWRPTQHQMLLGYGQQGPLYCGLEDMLSVGIVGRPKTGKSTLLRFVYIQCVLVGARVVVWDLHRTIVGSLPGAEALTRLPDIDASAQQIAAELDRRLDTEEYAAQPIMVLADEFPMLAPNSETATTTLNRIILEGRKVNLFTMIAGQGLPARLFGEATPRESLSTRYVLHTTTRIARQVDLDKDLAPLVVKLARGQAIIDGPIDPQVITIPNTTATDVQNVLAVSAPSLSPISAVSTVSAETTNARVETQLETTAETTPDQARKRQQVRDLLKAQTPITEIIQTVWGVTTGRPYQRASVEFREIVSELLP